MESWKPKGTAPSSGESARIFLQCIIRWRYQMCRSLHWLGRNAIVEWQVLKSPSWSPPQLALNHPLSRPTNPVLNVADPPWSLQNLGIYQSIPMGSQWWPIGLHPEGLRAARLDLNECCLSWRVHLLQLFSRTCRRVDEMGSKLRIARFW